MPKHRPIIGITGPVDGGKIFWQFSKLAIKLAGGQAQRITSETALNEDKYDGFIISGGHDIHPSLYGEQPMGEEASYRPKRDALEQRIINHALATKKPLLGICRGMQLINVTMGGSLFQEAADILEDFLPSKHLLSKVIGRRSVDIAPDSQLYDILGQYPAYNVNSIHHQAVSTLGDGLRIVAKEKNNLVQAIEATSSNIHPCLFGVQWHPELMLHARSARNLFGHIVKQAAKK